MTTHIFVRLSFSSICHGTFGSNIECRSKIKIFFWSVFLVFGLWRHTQWVQHTTDSFVTFKLYLSMRKIHCRATVQHVASWHQRWWMMMSLDSFCVHLFSCKHFNVYKRCENLYLGKTFKYMSNVLRTLHFCFLRYHFCNL
jgi:hypothetical protein